MTSREHTAICTVNEDGSITLRTRRLIIPGIRLERVIGSGANGVVVQGRHELLSRPVAVKFWLALRTRDGRDKLAQGIAEVNKALTAERTESVVRVRTAGESEGIFYAVMDLFTGKTVDAWLKDRPPLGLRRLVALRLVDEVSVLSRGSIYHGDLHTRNVLLDASGVVASGRGPPRLGIIDFGTSRFTSKGASRSRHWRVFNETLNEIVGPFELRQLAVTRFPDLDDVRSIRSWFRFSLVIIRHLLIRLGAEWLIQAEETHDFHMREWRSHAEMIADLYPVPRIALESTRALVANGAVCLTEEWLGDAEWWWLASEPSPSLRGDGFWWDGVPVPDETWV